MRCVAPASRLARGARARARDGWRESGVVLRRRARAGAATPYVDLAAALTATQRAQMLAYARAIERENRGEHGMLTGAASAEAVLESHCGDALALLETLDRVVGGADARVRVMDVGSGAGFPGIPLAIARPGWRFTLLDALRKRTTFLEAATDELGLSNVSVVWGRAEDVGKDLEHREGYDVVTARAVAELKVLAEFCVPLARVGGHWVAAKNATAVEEMADAANAVTLLGGGQMVIETVDAVGPDGRPRAAVVCKKIAPTPDKYPRRAGMAKKRPLA